MIFQRNGLLVCAAAIAVSALTGCVSLGTMQRAETLGQGKVQFGIEPTAWGVSVGKTTVALPSVGASVRYGATDNFDIGGRVSLAGVEVQAKFRFPTPSGFYLSLAPSIGGLGATESAQVPATSTAPATTESVGVGYLNAQLPLLIGIPVGPHEFIIAPKLIDYALFGGVTSGTTTTASGNLLFGGASIGFAARINPGFQLLPEVSIAYPLLASGSIGSTSASTSALNADGLLFQVGLGFLLGS